MKTDEANFLKPILSTQFKATRKRLNLSQLEMSERLHISVRSYADLERGISLCSAPVLLRYILCCELTPLDLFELLALVGDAFEGQNTPEAPEGAPPPQEDA